MCQHFAAAIAANGGLVIVSSGPGLFIIASGIVISVRPSVYHGADCFIPVRAVDVSRASALYCRSIPNQLKHPANRPSFNEAISLRSRGLMGAG
jgi:hypothetical protein